MNRTDLFTATIRQLYLHYWIILSSLVLLLLLILFQLIPFWQESRPVSIILERYLIVVTLIAIPLALKMFASRLKKDPLPLTGEDARGRYKSASLWRLYILTAVTLFHLLLFGISRNMNFFWFTIVLFTVFLFCRPSYQELENLLETPAGSDTGHLDNEDHIGDDTTAGK
ncbi:MAG TPA: hypothetical protein PLH60_04730 [Proteiniphilum sp.]|mgnify:CR=1 FL=1|nr:hypothetical protein [Proteiniphilum sp.]HPJ51213.1 hypothetical protein [Proteiniphilum sp.]HPR19846.1 hypothetical protein [Proteiniphilum sp.]